MLFNRNLPISLESSKSSFSLTEEDTNALKMDTAFGQGKTYVSPLHMAMIAGAIANDGLVMQPTLIERLQSFEGILIEKEEPSEYDTIFTSDEVALLSEYMRETIIKETSGDLNSDHFTAYGKTGTAQTSSDLNNTNAWFVGYATKEGYEDIAIAVVVENSGSGARFASPIARKIFELYFK
jgi:peptidoglycan glycosyltransferase